MAEWTDAYWTSNDDLTLHYRDYPGDRDRPPILCIPGLTRNARDFEGVAARLTGRWRVICVDLRGRGESAQAKDPLTYVPVRYVDDIERLIDHLGLTRFIAFGTSLGGLITMLLAMRDSRRLAGALLNDIGPSLETAGLDHIRSYLGKAQNWPTWLHAARALADLQQSRYPRWKLDDWLVYAKRIARLSAGGRIVYDYDMRIAEPFKVPVVDGGIDLWTAFAALRDVPTLLVKGALTDLISDETVRRMERDNPSMETVVVPDVGHAPTLDEPEAVAAIDRLLARALDGAGAS